MSTIETLERMGVISMRVDPESDMGSYVQELEDRIADLEVRLEEAEAERDDAVVELGHYKITGQLYQHQIYDDMIDQQQKMNEVQLAMNQRVSQVTSQRIDSISTQEMMDRFKGEYPTPGIVMSVDPAVKKPIGEDHMDFSEDKPTVLTWWITVLIAGGIALWLTM